MDPNLFLNPFVRRRTAPVLCTTKPVIVTSPAPPVPIQANSVNDVFPPAAVAPKSKTKPEVKEDNPRRKRKQYLAFKKDGEEWEEIDFEIPVVAKKEFVSLYEFKLNEKFILGDIQEMEYEEIDMNIYGKPCTVPINTAAASATVTSVSQVVSGTMGPADSAYGQRERQETLKQRKLARMIDYKAKCHRKQVNLNVLDDNEDIYKMAATRTQRELPGSSYYIFVKGDNNVCNAYPVKHFCSFVRHVETNVLTEEEADEAYKKRDKILNYFSLMVNQRLKTQGELDMDCVDGVDLDANMKRTKGSLVSGDIEFMDTDDDDDDDDCDSDPVRVEEVGNEDNGRKKKLSKKKRQIPNSPNVSQDEDDFACMDDRSSEEETSQDDAYQCGVADEEGLRDLLVSDNDASEEEERKPDSRKKDGTENPKKRKSMSAAAEAIIAKCKSKILSSLDKANPGTVTVSKENQKRATVEFKKKELPKITPQLIQQARVAGVTSYAVERYLSRKPITLSEILAKFYKQAPGISKENVASVVGHLIRELNARKERINGKMTFFLPTQQDLDSPESYFNTFGLFKE